LYFFSGASDDFRIVDDAAAVGRTVMLATGILLAAGADVGGPGFLYLFLFLHRSMVEIV